MAINFKLNVNYIPDSYNAEKPKTSNKLQPTKTMLLTLKQRRTSNKCKLDNNPEIVFNNNGISTVNGF